jgi:hypothetical protein
LDEDSAINQHHLLRRLGEKSLLRVIVGHQLRRDQIGGSAAIALKDFARDHIAVMRQYIIEPETAMLLNDPYMIGDRVPFCLVGLGHQVADKDFARIGCADGFVDLFDEQRWDQVGKSEPGPITIASALLSAASTSGVGRKSEAGCPTTSENK